MSCVRKSDGKMMGTVPKTVEIDFPVALKFADDCWFNSGV